MSFHSLRDDHYAALRLSHRQFRARTVLGPYVGGDGGKSLHETAVADRDPNHFQTLSKSGSGALDLNRIEQVLPWAPSRE
jgi:hypothetical protein